MVNWKEHGNPFLDFTEEITQKWIDKGFNKEECKEWIDIGMKAEDVSFIYWLRNVKGKTAEWALNHEDSEKDLREKHKKYLENQNSGKNTRNILLIGRTGNGKSAFANMFVNKSEKFEEVFKESAGSASETRAIQATEFEINLSKDGDEIIRYRIIDTVGIGDTSLTTQGVLYKLAEATSYIKEGLNQIFFIMSGRFTAEEIEAYNLLKSVIFDNEVNKYTTIIRTRFSEFYDEKACESDHQVIYERNKDFFDSTGSVKVIHVDNPPIVGLPKTIEAALESREYSRKKVITYLGTCQKIYRPGNLDTFKDRVSTYKTEKQKLEGEVKKRTEELRKLANNQCDIYQNLYEETVNFINKRRKTIEKVKEIKSELNDYLGVTKKAGAFTSVINAVAPAAQYMSSSSSVGTGIKVIGVVGSLGKSFYQGKLEKDYFEKFKKEIEEDEKNGKEYSLKSNILQNGLKEFSKFSLKELDELKDLMSLKDGIEVFNKNFNKYTLGLFSNASESLKNITKQGIEKEARKIATSTLTISNALSIWNELNSESEWLEHMEETIKHLEKELEEKEKAGENYKNYVEHWERIRDNIEKDRNQLAQEQQQTQIEQPPKGNN